MLGWLRKWRWFGINNHDLLEALLGRWVEWLIYSTSIVIRIADAPIKIRKLHFPNRALNFPSSILFSCGTSTQFLVMAFPYGPSRSHKTTHYCRQDSSGRVISPTQRPLTENTQPSQATNIHDPEEIRNRSSNKPATADPRLRACGHWNWHSNVLWVSYLNFWVSVSLGVNDLAIKINNRWMVQLWHPTVYSKDLKFKQCAAEWIILKFNP